MFNKDGKIDWQNVWWGIQLCACGLLMIVIFFGLTLCPLWVWLGQGHSVYNSDGSAVDFGLSFIVFVFGLGMGSFMAPSGHW